MQGKKFVFILIMALAIILPFQQVTYASNEGTITGENVNVRSAPSVNESKILGKLNKGQKVPVIEVLNDAWVKISYKNGEAFVSRQFIEIPPKKQEVSIKKPNTVEIFVNNNKLELPFELPNENNSLLVPFRLISEAIGIKVDWIQETRQVIAIDQGREVIFTIDQQETMVNGEIIVVDPSPKIVNSSTVIPLRFFAETFGATVNWIQETRTVEITRKIPKPPASSSDVFNYSAVVNTNLLNVRTGPGTNEPILTKLLLGDQLEVISFENEWLKVTHESGEGFVHSAFVKLFHHNEEVRLLRNPSMTTDGEQLLLTWFKYGGVETTIKQGENNRLTIATNAKEVIPILEKEHKYIKKVTYEQTEVGMNINVELNAKYHVNVSNGTGQLIITIGPSGLQGRKIVIDAGHGGKDPGAVVNRSQEKEIVLDVSLRVQELLEKAGAEVLMTRADDRFLELWERVAFANDNKADSFVSIHANAATNAAANGTETFWNSTYSGPESLLLAQKLHAQLIDKLGTNDRKVKEGKFQVIRQTTMPSVLIELGFMTNPEEALKLATDEFRQKAAEAIFQGLNDYYQ